MSFSYNTKTLEELQEISKIIVDNLAPLVGCRQNSKLWSPPVGFSVATKLNISGFECTNVARDSIDLGYIEESLEYRSPLLNPVSYEFDTTVSELAKTLWESSKKLQYKVLDSSYFSTLKINLSLSQSEKMRICSEKCKEYNSTIYSALIQNQPLSYTPHSRYLCLILLQAFTIRYALYDFALGLTSSIDSVSINHTLINTAIKNCEYEKYVLSTLDLECYNYDISPEFIQYQLTLLIKNYKQLKSYVMAYINL